MSRRLRSALVSLFVACTISSVACSDSGGSGPDPDDAIASVTVSPPQATVDIGSTTQFSATVLNGHGETVPTSVSWSSLTPAVAMVSGSGLVTGVTEGASTITASAGGHSGQAAVTVDDPFPPQQPSNISASPVSNTEIQVTWTDNANNEDEFRIDREQNAGATGPESQGPSRVFAQVGTAGPNATSFSDTGLQPETTYRYRVRACNQNGCSEPTAGSSDVSTFSELVIETQSLPGIWTGEVSSHTLQASGGDGAPSWSVSSGALPDGIMLSGAGELSGTPTVSGSFTFTVQATGGGQAVTKELSLEVYAPLSIVTASLPNGVQGSTYQQDLSAFGGDGTYIWALLDGALPPGVNLGASGSLTGTPTSNGSFAFTLQVSSAGRTASAGYVVGVFDALAISTAALPPGATGSAYSITLSAAGGDGAYTWSVSAGVLPAGLSLAPASGDLSGTPTEDGTFLFTAQVQSGDGQTAAADLSLDVAFVFNCSIQSEIPQAECEALEVLFNTTNGPGWTESTNWLADFEPCGWNGVVCSEGTVTQIYLPSNGLSGPFPQELTDLQNLQTLNLGWNDITGSLPADIGDLSSLEKLNLSSNKVGGTIPAGLATLANLQRIEFNGNEFTGPIPPELGNLAQLVRLDMGSNDLSGTIPPELGNLANLRMFNLPGNQLTGSIPPELGNLGNLYWFYVQYNQLTGSIPPELGNLSSLDWIILSNNQLTGAIPSELANLADLEHLNLHNNQLTGPIPSELGNLANLNALYLYSNQLSGAIPAELGNLTNLKDFYLYSNQLSGVIPLTVAQLGGVIQNTQGLSNCDFLPGNPGLSLVENQDYRDADLDADGFICEVAFPPGPTLEASTPSSPSTGSRKDKTPRSSPSLSRPGGIKPTRRKAPGLMPNSESS